MPDEPTLRTSRLLLRPWEPTDEAAMAAVNRNPEVARYLNRPVDEVSVAACYGVMVEHWSSHGYGPWVLESIEPGSEGSFLGFAGLAHTPQYLAGAGEEPEIGWRLGPAAWGRGLATEAAIAVRDDAFERLGFRRLISIIHPENTRSQRVAIKLGMSREREIYNPLLRREVDVWTLSAPARTTGRTDDSEVRP